MAGQKVKGIILKSRIDFLERIYGPTALDKLLPHLKGRTKEVFSDPRKIRATGWYDFEINLEFDDAIFEVLANRDETVFWKMGAFTNDFQTTDSSKHAYKDPWKYLVLHVGIWPRFWKPGRAELIKVSEEEALIHIHEMRGTRRYCQTNIGFFHSGLELAGAREVSVIETQCAEDPKVRYCEYRITFKLDHD